MTTGTIVILVMVFLLGLAIGLIIGVWRLSAKAQCEIHIINADEDKPYLYLAVNKSVNYLASKKYVLAEIKVDDYVSQ